MDSTVSLLLERLRGGDREALSALTSELYKELHLIAGRRIRLERPDHTLQATALVHEAYLKLCDVSQLQFNDRAHFLAVASRVMRQVLVDHARARSARKRSGENHQVTMEVPGRNGVQQWGLLELDRALQALAVEDQHMADLVEMRFFGGMTAEESAAALSESVHVVRHDIRIALAWLRRALSK